MYSAKHAWKYVAETTLPDGSQFRRLTPEHLVNYVPSSFYTGGEDIMARTFAEEALALTALSLFLAMVAVWAQVLGVV